MTDTTNALLPFDLYVCKNCGCSYQSTLTECDCEVGVPFQYHLFRAIPQAVAVDVEGLKQELAIELLCESDGPLSHNDSLLIDHLASTGRLAAPVEVVGDYVGIKFVVDPSMKPNEFKLVQQPATPQADQVSINRNMLDCFAKGKTKSGIPIYVLLKENDLHVYDLEDGLKRAIAAMPSQKPQPVVSVEDARAALIWIDDDNLYGPRNNAMPFEIQQTIRTLLEQAANQPNAQEKE